MNDYTSLQRIEIYANWTQTLKCIFKSKQYEIYTNWDEENIKVKYTKAPTCKIRPNAKIKFTSLLLKNPVESDALDPRKWRGLVKVGLNKGDKFPWVSIYM